MNIRMALYALIASFCFQAIAMDQEQFMKMTPSEILEVVEMQISTDKSFVLNTARNVTLELIVALLLQDKIQTTLGKIAAGALGVLFLSEGISFVNGIAQFVAQKAEQEKMFRALLRQQKILRDHVLNSGDSEQADEIEE